MQTYEFVCQKCGEAFEVRASISQYSQGLRPACPHCHSRRVTRTFSAVNVLTSRPVSCTRSSCSGCRARSCGGRS